MTQNDVDSLRENSKLFWDCEVWRVVVNIQHRFEDGYEPSDMDSLRLDFRQQLPNPTGRMRNRQFGALWIDVNICGLRLERGGEILIACHDSSEKVLERLKELVGKALVRVEIAAPGGDTDFVLEDGLVLRCFPATQDGGAWRISSAEGG